MAGQKTRPFLFWRTYPPLERIQEIDQVGLFPFCKADIETLVVELDDVTQVAGRAVMEIRCARRESTQDWSLEQSDICALASDHGLAQIGNLIDLPGERTLRAI